jgi:hypothetical protein
MLITGVQILQLGSDEASPLYLVYGHLQILLEQIGPAGNKQYF